MGWGQHNPAHRGWPGNCLASGPEAPPCGNVVAFQVWQGGPAYVLGDRKSREVRKTVGTREFNMGTGAPSHGFGCWRYRGLRNTRVSNRLGLEDRERARFLTPVRPGPSCLTIGWSLMSSLQGLGRASEAPCSPTLFLRGKCSTTSPLCTQVLNNQGGGEAGHVDWGRGGER